MKKILFATVCATTLFLGASMINAQEILPPPPPQENACPADCKCMKKGEFKRRGGDFEKRHGRGEGGFDHEKIREKMEQRADKFANDLGLTAEQKEQAGKIRETGRKEIEPLMKEMKDLRGRMDALRDKNMKDFENILTPEQKTKLEQMKTERGSEHRKNRLEGRRGNRPAEQIPHPMKK